MKAWISPGAPCVAVARVSDGYLLCAHVLLSVTLTTVRATTDLGQQARMCLTPPCGTSPRMLVRCMRTASDLGPFSRRTTMHATVLLTLHLLLYRTCSRTHPPHLVLVPCPPVPAAPLPRLRGLRLPVRGQGLHLRDGGAPARQRAQPAGGGRHRGLLPQLVRGLEPGGGWALRGRGLGGDQPGWQPGRHRGACV